MSDEPSQAAKEEACRRMNAMPYTTGFVYIPHDVGKYGFPGLTQLALSIDAETKARAERDELDRERDQAIGERDAAELALSDAYQAVTGRQAEWSNLFDYERAVKEMAEYVAARNAECDEALAMLRRLRSSLGPDMSFKCKTAVDELLAKYPEPVDLLRRVTEVAGAAEAKGLPSVELATGDLCAVLAIVAKDARP